MLHCSVQEVKEACLFLYDDHAFVQLVEEPVVSKAQKLRLNEYVSDPANQAIDDADVDEL